MDTFEKTGYLFLGIVAGFYIIAMIVGMIAVFPIGLLGLFVFTGVGILFIKVLKERISNKEDDYYEKKVDK